MAIPIEDFGRDHWSTFAYIETCVVDCGGRVAKERMRCIHKRHPFFAHRGGDASAYPTRLRGGRKRNEHDDWDCLDDIEVAGLIENIDICRAPAGALQISHTEAVRREHDIATIKLIYAMTKLPLVKSGWGQHTANEVRAMREALFEILVDRVPYFRDRKDRLTDINLYQFYHPSSIWARIIDDYSGENRVLAHAYDRLARIDRENREWEQPYFVENVDKGLKEFPKPTVQRAD